LPQRRSLDWHTGSFDGEESQVRVWRAVTTSAQPQRTKVDTPSTTLADSEQIEVTDPAHPLFGRRFGLVARRGRAQEPSACVLVAYRDSILIKLPVGVTHLSSAAASAARTKLDAEAVRQLLAFVKECEPPCASSPKTSGRTCPRRAASKSSKTSSPSSRS
jgi:hypothetical protein